VFGMITISRYRSQTQIVHILFIARCSLKLTTCFGLSSIRPLSGHKYFTEETKQYMLQCLNQFILLFNEISFSSIKSYYNNLFPYILDYMYAICFIIPIVYISSNI